MPARLPCEKSCRAKSAKLFWLSNLTPCLSKGSPARLDR